MILDDVPNCLSLVTVGGGKNTAKLQNIKVKVYLRYYRL